MAKKKTSGSFPWLETLGVGVAAFAVYKIFFAGTPATTPAAAPPAPGAPASIPTTPAVAPTGAPTAARGPVYKYWAITIYEYNQEFLNGTISLPVLQEKLSQTRLGIIGDKARGLLTSADVDDLNSDITTYGG